MIEVLVSLFVGYVVGNWIHHETGSCVADVRTENRALREGIRIARTRAQASGSHFLASYLGHFLDDEAGA